MRTLIFVELVIALTGYVQADEPSPEARARAALALAAAPPPTAAAPAPRAVPVTYAEAKKESLERGEPVVIYVGCAVTPRVPGTISVAVDELQGYQPGSLVVCYPSGSYLWSDAVLQCPATPGEVKKAVDKAAKKSEAKVHKALSWD